MIKIIICILFLLLAGCEKEDDSPSCQGAIDALIDERGHPEEVNKYDDGDYHSWTYWYYTKGYSETFTWGGAAGDCSSSTYTFSPIK